MGKNRQKNLQKLTTMIPPHTITTVNVNIKTINTMDIKEIKSAKIENRTGVFEVEVEEKAGEAWLNYIKQFPKLEEIWNNIPEPLNIYLRQQIDVFAGKYPKGEDGWISVSDRLPEVDNKKDEFGERIECLVVYEGHVYMGTFTNFLKPRWSISFIHSRESLNVTHWQPKPELPKSKLAL